MESTIHQRHASRRLAVPGTSHIIANTAMAQAITTASALGPPKWVQDLNNPPPAKPKNASIPDPPGFTAAVSGNKVSLVQPHVK
jgi:hypothetical protein